MALTLQNFAYAILGIVALAAMDLSSYCHPAPEAPDMPLIAKARAAEAAPVISQEHSPDDRHRCSRKPSGIDMGGNGRCRL